LFLADSEEIGYNQRSKRVHDLYEVYNRNIVDNGQAVCLNDIMEDPIVRGFSHEGAIEICQAAQLKNMSDDHKHFYPPGDLPRNKIEYTEKVRDIMEILMGLWFVEEGGQPSIVALIREGMVGDHVLADLGVDADTWQGGHDQVVQNAVQHDGHVVDPPIRPNKGWKMEMMSNEAPNVTRISNWETKSS
jgi:hypothetical protein